MTTNHPKLLDKALIRPGRIDLICEFTNCTNSMIVEFIEKFYDISLEQTHLNIIMKLNFNFNLTDLDGLPIENANAGKLLANTLAQQAKGDALKFWEWALALNKGEIINLDTSDQTVLKNFIKESDALAILAKGQLLQVFKED